MNAKLTLKLNSEIIEKAKQYASEKKMSLSKIIESYLNMITHKKALKDEDISPLVKSISGVIKLPKNYNHKKEYSNYLAKKYK